MIDLHTHSSMSDGTYTPEALMDLALETGLGALALTDHDTLAGLDRAAARARGTPLVLVPGVELEIACDTGEFHLLGLGLDGDRGGLEEALATVRRDRHDRNVRMVAHLASSGIPVTLEELAAVSGGGVVSRAHFARLLVQKGVVKRTEDAFSRYIGKGRPFYEPRRTLELKDAVRLVARAGGVAVVAHPLSLGLAGAALRQKLAHARDAGVAGIEAWHPKATVRDCRRLERLAVSIGLAVTAGSDFHGLNLPQRRLGYTAGGLAIDDRYVSVLRLKAATA
jgi:predicted metal-dependent phosphoesterase TrpH